MADSLSLGDSLFFFSSPPASPDEASLQGGLGWRRNEQMAGEGVDVDKNCGRVAVTGDGKGKCVGDRDRKIKEEIRGWRRKFWQRQTNYDFMSRSDVGNEFTLSFATFT